MRTKRYTFVGFGGRGERERERGGGGEVIIPLFLFGLVNLLDDDSYELAMIDDPGTFTL